jgi:type IV fimbrial biogenesis protein FimT
VVCIVRPATILGILFYDQPPTVYCLRVLPHLAKLNSRGDDLLKQQLPQSDSKEDTMTQTTSNLPHVLNVLQSSTSRRNLLPSKCEITSVRFAADPVPPDISPQKPGSWRSLNILHQAGFTLVEVLIAIAIISILSAIAVPNVLTEMPKFRLNGASRQVLGDLMTARMKAVSQNKKVKVFFIGGSQYKICDDADHSGTVDNCEGNAKTIDIQSNFPGISLNSGGNDPVFSPRGTSSNTTISLASSYGTKTITIAITGRVKIS